MKVSSYVLNASVVISVVFDSQLVEAVFHGSITKRLAKASK